MDYDSQTSVAKDFHRNGDTKANSLNNGDGIGNGIGNASHSNDAQAGVKNIEAVATIWMKWGLTAAYARYADLFVEYCLYVVT